jgi:hypothetical protein
VVSTLPNQLPASSTGQLLLLAASGRCHQQLSLVLQLPVLVSCSRATGFSMSTRTTSSSRNTLIDEPSSKAARKVAILQVSIAIVLYRHRREQGTAPERARALMLCLTLAALACILRIPIFCVSNPRSSTWLSRAYILSRPRSGRSPGSSACDATSTANNGRTFSHSASSTCRSASTQGTCSQRRSSRLRDSRICEYLHAPKLGS